MIIRSCMLQIIGSAGISASEKLWYYRETDSLNLS